VRGPEDGQPLLPAGGQQAVVAGREKDLVQDFPDLSVVVDDQDPRAVDVQVTFSGELVVATWFLPARLAA
jgi:hypothetical protein